MALERMYFEAPGIRLYVTQHQGQEPSLVWNGPQHAARIGLDTVLAEVGWVGSHLHEQTHLCTLENVGSPQSPMWLLSHGSTTLVCSVNGNILQRDSQIRLDHGDQIEYGLLHIDVVLNDLDKTPQAVAAGVDSSSARVDEQFDLTDLDSQKSTEIVPDHERYGRERAYFGDLISLADEPIVERSPSPLNQETAKHPLTSLLVPMEHAHENVAVDGLRGQRSAVTDVPSDVVGTKADPLEELHARYLDKLRDPSNNDELVSWKDSTTGDAQVMHDPVRRWMNQAGPQHGLDDLLNQSVGIDSVIAALDSLPAWDISAPEPHDSVMHLFAPDELRPQDQDPLKLLLQSSLPRLTRSEHHSLSLDSAMPFVGGEERPSTLKKS